MDNEELQQNTEQPSDLFAYIGSRQSEAVTEQGVVNADGSEAPVAKADENVVENANEAAPGGQETQGVTTPANQVQSGEADRLREQVREMEVREAQRLQAFALLAKAAQEREEEAFTKSLDYMTEEEANGAKGQRRMAQIEAENTFLRQQQQAREQQEAITAEQIDKIAVAHKVVDRLKLPADNQFVMQSLMGSADPNEMFAKAQRLSEFFQATQMQTSKQAAQQAAQRGVHAAGGESAPAAPPKAVSQRSGELIDMMREREYVLGA